MRLYQDLAWLWSEMTPSETYLEEAYDLYEIAEDALQRTPRSWIELGAGVDISWRLYYSIIQTQMSPLWI